MRLAAVSAQSARSVSELLLPYRFRFLDLREARVEQLSVHLPSSSALSSILNSSHSPAIAFPRLVLLTRGGDGGTCRLARLVILRCFSVLSLRVPVSTTTIFSPQLLFFFVYLLETDVIEVVNVETGKKCH